jgi:Ca2+-binding EF-hand superfamily protein
LTREKVDQIFKEFDNKQVGQISVDDIKTTFSKFGKTVSDEEIDIIMSHHDCDGDYKLSVDEFKSIFDLHKS